MDNEQAKGIKVGDAVIWPEGANGCREDRGIVEMDPITGSMFVKWTDGQVTYFSDGDAVRFIQRA